ncbi:MAG: glycosyltransferase family 2 protein [Pontiellaceae bacterium]|nr:glycosyltransferase family 2 protein [Pontiellaceae bacterium]MBN2785662.1 glycosyltransferase family 2 protein [Pontiellaceae bacterium]
MSSLAIVMRAKDEMPHVRYALRQLKRQTIQDFELFAVDSGSTDGTLDELRQHAHRLRQIRPDEYVPGAVLNQAIAQTDSEIIVLLNADAVPRSADFLEQLIQPLQAHQADAVFARQVARDDARFIVDYDYQRAYRPDRMEPTFFSAVACAFRRSLWETCRFRETGYAEDLAWAESVVASGARLRFVPEAVVEHSHNYSLKGLFRKRFRQAMTFGTRPILLKQLTAFLREIVRDLLYAVRKVKLQTIPYNIVYRIMLHAGVYQGLRSGWKKRTGNRP